jgi:ABC-2 type transport system ATP-binding protein
MTPRLTLNAVSRRYGRREALANVTLSVEPGEAIALIGPNGGGKSTLLLLMAGLIAPSQGTVCIDGEDARSLINKARGVVGLITAEPGFYPLLTGEENLRFFGSLWGLPRSVVDQRGRPRAEALGLTEALARPLREWSSGMRQKLSLVRAQLTDPKVLLFDEPTANLDPLAASIVWQAVQDATRDGVAVVFATHDLHAAERAAHRVAVIERTIRHIQPMVRSLEPAAPAPLLHLYQTHTEQR